MLVTRESMFTGVKRTVNLPVTREQLFAWRDGGLVQDVFPNLSVDQREFLISGTTPDEWKQYCDEWELYA